MLVDDSALYDSTLRMSLSRLGYMMLTALGITIFVGALREQSVSEIAKFYVWNDGKKLFGQNW